MIIKRLDTMAIRGLHDHLQGGFYRYCVDETWTIPHFEKMLYDQAMHLWVYSAAYKIFRKEEYKTIAEKVVNSLEQEFEENGLFYSALDADTDHQEGITYLWTKNELSELLSEEDIMKLKDVYELQENFEGKIHLIKKKNRFLPEIEDKLLQIRKERKQPFVDNKIMTSWNALAGIALIQAGYWLERDDYLLKADRVFAQLVKINSQSSP